MTAGIYTITEIETGRVYVGQSKQIEKRWKRHQKTRTLQHYTYEILREVTIPQFMDSFEKFYINLYDSHRNGLNRTVGGTAIKATHPHAETLVKMSSANKGQVPWNKGKSHSPETRSKMSTALQGRTSPNKGKTLSLEQKTKLSLAVKLYWQQCYVAKSQETV